MAEMTETWRPIAACQGYEVSDCGRVRSVPRVSVERGRWGPMKRNWKGRILRPWRSNSGYLMLTLGADRSKRFYIHQLVANAFLSEDETRRCVNHIDGMKENNTAGNLERVTQHENMRHSTRVLGNTAGQFRPKLSPDQMASVRSQYVSGGVCQARLSTVFGVSARTIRRALCR